MFRGPKRWYASRMPRSPEVMITSGTEAASSMSAHPASPRSAVGTRMAVRTSHGLSDASTTAPAAPSSSITSSVVRTRPGISSSRPCPNRSAIAWVKARPSPRSKRLK